MMKAEAVKTYNQISYEMRLKLIDLVNKEKLSIKQACRLIDINYSTGKLIIKKFFSTGKITRFSTQKEQNSRTGFKKADLSQNQNRNIGQNLQNLPGNSLENHGNHQNYQNISPYEMTPMFSNFYMNSFTYMQIFQWNISNSNLYLNSINFYRN